ncbi:MAG: DNA polymerase I [Muribaculaceae bacterium]|nr:DNA polymerase I [Muribaculaceae bacterium]
MQAKKLLLLDAYALIFRAFYAMIRNPRLTSTGIDTSAVFGFVNMLQDLLKREQPSHIAVCFDPGGKTFRHEAFPEYKANRDKTPEGILTAVPYIKRILAAYRIPVIVVDGYEADDVIGTMSHQAQEHGFFTYMVTGDKDFGQLVTDQIKINNPGKNEILGVEEVKAKYGIESPQQVIDLLGLMGDSADNIPGCPGVGEKTAIKLVQEFGSIENLLEHTDQLKGALKTKIENNVEQIKFSKYLATIKTDVPIEWDEDALRREPADLDALEQVFSELEFRTFTARLINQGEANIGVPATTPPPASPKEGGAPSDSKIDLPPIQEGQKGATQKEGVQLSLFDVPAIDSTPPPTPPLPLERGLGGEADCQLVSDTYAAEDLVKRLVKEPQVGLHLVSMGEEAMRGTLVGVALCADTDNAYYLPMDGMGFMLQTLEPLFTGQARIVTNDAKRLMVMLDVAGVKMTAPYYDVGVAHYLLQPERTHSTADIAAELLHYTAMSEQDLVGAKGRKQLPLDQVPAERITRWAGEQAMLNLAMQLELDKHLADEGLTHLLTDIELPLVQVLARMELAGARIDVKALQAYSLSLQEQIHTLEEECQRLAGVSFNTASPAQVGQVLFEKLQLDPKAKKTKTGQYSTTEEILTKLKSRHPIVGKILDLRGKRKLLSTYVDALPQLINPRTGRIHTTFNQTVTATGRLSSTNPNLQNIPVRTEEGREIRRAFIPADGNVFFSADYSQIELRLVADLSGDKTMLEAFAHDQDIHAITAARIYHEQLEQVTPEQRRRAKTANFGILYGISAFGLAERLDIPRSEAKMLIDGYFATFPGVRDYIDRSVQQARERGFVTTLEGRRRMLPDINSRNAVVRSFSERNAVNAPIQGTAADIIKRAMVAIDRRFRDEGLQSKMILQVHDELNFDVVPTEIEQVQRIVIGEMEAAYKGRVHLTASHAAADNWLDAH